MNKVLLFIGFALLVNVGHSQYDSKVDGPISQFKAGFMWFYTGLRPAKEDKVRKYDRLIFDLTYNDWNGDSKLFQMNLMVAPLQPPSVSGYSFFY